MTATQAKREQPAPGSIETAPEASPSDYGNLLEAAIIEAGSEKPAEELEDLDIDDTDEDEDEEESEDDADDDDDSDEIEASQEAEPKDDPIDQWAEKLRANPKRLSQIPIEQRQQVVARALTRTVEATQAEERELARNALPLLIAKVREEALKEFEATSKATSEFEEIQALEDDDPREFAEFAKDPKNASRMRRYYEYKESGRIEKETGIDADMRRELSEAQRHIEANPEVLRRLQARAQRRADMYANTAAGAARLIRDVPLVLAEIEQEKAREDTTAQSTVARRKAAAEKRKSLPKPETGEARGRKQPLPTNVNDLIAVGWEKGS